MQEKTESRHMVDILFVLTLFCVFALCALTLVTLGANVYQRTVDHMESNFESRTPTSYITQKVRQADWENGVYVTQFDGIEALLMKQTIQETSDPKMLLCERQSLIAQGICPKMLVCLAIVSK